MKGRQKYLINSKGIIRRREILEAAKKCLIDKGLNGLILRELGKELNITHGNVAYYFPTKNALIKAIFDEAVQKYTEGILSAVRKSSSLEDALSSLIEESFSVNEKKERVLWLILIGSASNNPDFSDILKRENSFYEVSLVKEIKLLAPHLDEARINYIAKILRTLLDGMAIELIYEKPSSTKWLAFKSEVKALFTTLVLSQ